MSGWDGQVKQDHEDLDAEVKMLGELLASKPDGAQPRWGALSHLVIRSLGPQLEIHLRKEEQILFPALEKLSGRKLEDLQLLIIQHEKLRTSLRQLANRLAEPRRQDVAWDKVSQAARDFMETLSEHERQEERLVKTALESALKPAELVKLAEGFHQVAWKAFQEEL